MNGVRGILEIKKKRIISSVWHLERDKKEKGAQLKKCTLYFCRVNDRKNCEQSSGSAIKTKENKRAGWGKSAGKDET